MVEEDADRRARESADYLGEHYGSRGTGPQGAGSWPADSWDADSWDADPRPDDFRTTRYHGPH
jgi:hypothetical protein